MWLLGAHKAGVCQSAYLIFQVHRQRFVIALISTCSGCIQVNGRAQSGPDLGVTHFSGLKLPNPFVIGSGER